MSRLSIWVTVGLLVVAAAVLGLLTMRPVVIKDEVRSRTGSEWEPIDGPTVPFRLLTSQKRLPPWDQLGEHSIALRLVENAEQFAQAWSFFQLEPGAFPEINWAKQVVLFAGVGESGSCPVTLSALSIRSEDTLVLHLSFAHEVSICTEDFTPRTFVAAIDKANLPAGPLRGTVKGMFGAQIIPLHIEK